MQHSKIISTFSAHPSLKGAAFLLLIFITASNISSAQINMPGGSVSTGTNTFYDAGGSAANYANNQNITTTLAPNIAGKYVSVAFTAFSIGLNSDYLYIYDGANTAAPLLGVYSGTQLPGTITARNSTGKLTFQFISDASGVSTGWAANVSLSNTCGSITGNYNMSNNAVDTISGGNFFDSGGSGSNYTNNENKTMTFFPANSGQYLSCTFSAFSTTLAVDYLYVYDGATTSATLIGKYSGTEIPGTITARNNKGCLTFQFISNASGASTGWAATFANSASKGSTTGSYLMTDLATDTICGGNFFDQGGSLNNYANSENKTMTFFPATAGQYLSTTFSAFSTTVQTDYLAVYDGYNITAPLIGQYSGTQSPGTLTARNATGALTFKWTSSASGVSSGWAATFGCAASRGSTTANYVMTDLAVDTVSAGTFYDDGGLANNYANSENKTMTFYPANSGQYVSVNFTAFSTESAGDFLYVYDGTSTAATLMGAYSGTTLPGTITARNAKGALTFKFVSSATVAGIGWTATISNTATKGSTTANYLMTDMAVDTVSGGTFYDVGGSANNYVNNETKTITFFPGTSGQKLAVAFSAFSTQAASDFLYIYDGTSSSANLIGAYSGTTSPGTIVATNAKGALTFMFTSSTGTVSSGWAASFSCVIAQNCTQASTFLMTNNAAATISTGTFYDAGGTGNYANNESKTMTFYPSVSGGFLQITFTAFNTQAANDVLKIYNGVGTAGTLLASLSGTTLPSSYTSTDATGALTFVFTSNASTVSTGWVATLGISGAATWNGSSDYDWFNTSNWSGCTVPSCSINAIIPAGCTYYPQITATGASVKDLTINVNATLIVSSGYQLQMCGSFINNGTFSNQSGATVQLYSGSGNQTISGSLTGSNKIKNLTINKTGGTVTLNNDIEISGDLITSNSTSILNVNGKNITLSGNFTNAAGSTTITGLTGSTITFNGSSQTYSPGGTLTLNNVTMSQTSGAATLSLSGNNLIIGTAGTLTLTQGIISTGSNYEVTVTNTASAAVSSGNVNSYVDGFLRRSLSGAAASYDFPVGNAAKGYEFANVTFTSTTTIPDLVANFNTWLLLPTIPTIADGGRIFNALPALDNGYWKITASANSTSGTYSVTLKNSGQSNATGIHYTVMKAPTILSSWGFYGNSSYSTTAANVSRSGISGFSVFSTVQETPVVLPVELTSFTGEKNGSDVNLKWTTESETNNDFFAVERSTDGNDFSEIGKLAGAGNSHQQHDYSFVDANISIGVFYYRLKQINFDNTFQYSNVIAVSANDNNNLDDDISGYVFENGDNFMLHLKIKSANHFTISIYNEAGQLVVQPMNKDFADNSDISEELPMGSLPPGMYIVAVQNNSIKPRSYRTIKRR